ncbi:MAG: UDP-3-O-(3-hydroxymyristoyl)glucosamine N-acyltransferase [Endomicrobiales bacterium]|nr:UDP-3-O-(3-hydroxymyristoyl)glucosamine N-acyltransferase [Endomicrobiales bacterium]
MKLTSKEIAKLVEGELLGQPDIVITGAAGLNEATPQDISFLENEKYIKHMSSSKAGLVIVAEKISNPNKPVIKAKNPKLAFAKILEIIEKENAGSQDVKIHPTAVISKNATLGKDVIIGPFVVIEDNVKIGNSTKILAQCFVGRNTKIGSECLIYPRVTIRENISIGNQVILHSGTVIGADGFGYTQIKEGIYKIPQIGTVEIQDSVEIGANVTVDRATTDKTLIGTGTKIDNLVQIAHNVHIGSNCIIIAGVCIAGSVKIGNNVTIAGKAAIAGHLEVGDGAVIGGKAGVTTDVKPKEVVSGFPARPHNKEMKIQALIHKLPEIYEQIKIMRKK